MDFYQSWIVLPKVRISTSLKQSSLDHLDGGWNERQLTSTDELQNVLQETFVRKTT